MELAYWRLKGGAVEVGVRIPFLDLFDDKISRGSEGDVVAIAFRHPGVNDAEHATLAIEDQRS